MTIENQAKLAIAYAGVVWGLFWLPLRALDHVGISGLWAVLLFYGIPALCMLPYVLLNLRGHIKGGPWLFALGLSTAIPLMLYSIAVLNTEVVRAMLLFYLSPVWSMALCRIFLNEPMTRVRWATLAIAFAGISFILHAENGIPLPQNLGDWSALAAGFLWSVSSVLLRWKQGFSANLLCQQNLLWSGVLAIPLVLILSPVAAPPLSLVLAQLWWLIPTLALTLVTGVYASMWGAPKLSPTIVGILYMTEIAAGSLSAALFANEPFGPREIAGIILITLAASLESILDYAKQRNATPG
jgi:drug/metabolite transporter (DMT)-like permease